MRDPDTLTVTLDLESTPEPLIGDLVLPSTAAGLVVFVHGSGSGRTSPRNRYVASALQGAGFGTLLFDLLTPAEERVDMVTRHLRFDIDLLTERVAGALEWLRERSDVRDAPIGLFGASTGAAAAIRAAARAPELVSAVVSRGGRPDLAADALDTIAAPTLLIVGTEDHDVLALNRAALDRMRCPRALHLVEGATHLFEEEGALDEVIGAATRWFTEHLGARPHPWPVGPAAEAQRRTRRA